MNDKLAVIIVSYNKANLTILCIDSLYSCKNQIPFKVFLIDNFSRVEEKEKLLTFVEYVQSIGWINGHKVEIEVILSEENLGFSGGNNLGIVKALNDDNLSHICLLNNDTIVSDFWADTLIDKAMSDSLVGPVTNSVGNEQIVPIDYPTFGANGIILADVKRFANKWMMLHRGNVVKSNMLGFFCVLGSIKLFKDVGLLDEAFGIGTFEDDDYCMRCLEKGYSLKIVREVFIHHWGSASFSSIAPKFFNELSSRNKKIFESKHGISWKSPVSSLALALELEFENLSTKVASQSDSEIIKSYLDKISDQILYLHNEKKYTPPVYWFEMFKYNYDFAKLKMRQKLSNEGFFLVALIIKAFGSVFSRRVLNNLKGDVIRLKSILMPTLKHWRNRRRFKMRNDSNSLVIYLPCSPFKGRFQRSQHLAKGLAELGFDIVWFEPETTPKRLSSDIIYFDRIERFGAGSIYFVKTKIVDFNDFYVSGITDCQSNILMSFLKEVIVHKKSSVNLLINQPYWAKMINSFKENFPGHGNILYDCMDDHASFNTSTLESKIYHELILKQSGIILASSEYIKNQIEKEVNITDVPVIRNGVNVLDFNKGNYEAKPLKVVGYFGAIAEWFDHELIISVANLMKDYKFELIGNFDQSEIKNIKLPCNIVLLGEIPYRDLPAIASNWESAIIPFRISPLILATNPVKLYEYSALGLPVVSTPIPEVMISKVDVRIAHNENEFAQHLRNVDLSLPSKTARMNFAASNTWESRSKQLAEHLL